MKHIISVLIVLIMSSCGNFSEESTKEKISKSFGEGKEQMQRDFSKLVDSVKIKYEDVIKKIKDSIDIGNLKKNNHDFWETIKSLDSLREEVEKIGDNHDLVKNKFFNQGNADFVFNKMLSVYSALKSISKSSNNTLLITKSQRDILGEPNINENKNQYFGLNTRFGASSIIYGMETEALNLYLKTLDEYLP